MNNSDISAYINDFDPKKDKRRHFISFLVYAMVYLSISSNLVTLATLSPWSDSVYMHTWYLFFSKHLLR